MKISSFVHDGRTIEYVDLQGMLGPEQYRALPFVKRVLLENVARNALQNPSLAIELKRLATAEVAEDNEAYPLRVPRIILPDSSGVPVLMDLAALRSELHRQGRDASAVGAQIPMDLVIDHSLQVDFSASPDALMKNLDRELQRNGERYSFLKWAQQAFPNLSVYPPGSGIIHQIHIEQIACITLVDEGRGTPLAFPDFAVGGDSHTPMVNALGVLGWGVGGIEAEAVALGEYYMLPVPCFVGVRMVGTLRPGVTMTDAVLASTQILRAAGVVGNMLEFFGPAASSLSVPDRATLANMAPEYGATTGFWPVDGTTLDYLRLTGRAEAHVSLVEVHMRAAGLWREDPEEEPAYDRVIEIDLSRIGRNVAGPGKPHLRKSIAEVAPSFRERAGSQQSSSSIPHGAVAIAAITSCTNTANPEAMLRAGLLARNAHSRGLRSASWTKTSLAPGSRTVTEYLGKAGLMAPLEALGFHVVGYGCTTCGGKSGPLVPEVTEAVEHQGAKVAAVLSGNRNFDGRIHRLVAANYLCSPALVIAYALAGTVQVDLDNEPLGKDADGKDVMLSDLWPDDGEVRQLMSRVVTADLYKNTILGATVGQDAWSKIVAAIGPLFDWDPRSTYIVEPPFFQTAHGATGLPSRLADARAIGVFGDGLTTDHISPSGEIPAVSPAGRYLLDLGIARADFNTYVGRRGNHHVMVRGTYANIRLKNQLVEHAEGSWTRVFPEGAEMDIHAAAETYRRRGAPTIVLAGKDFGAGSSRDWAAKGQYLLGIAAIVAISFERIHRSNLIGMGILPLTFMPNENMASLGLKGSEAFDLDGLHEAIADGSPVIVRATSLDGRITTFLAMLDARSTAERALLQCGGIFQSALRNAMARSGPA